MKVTIITSNFFPEETGIGQVNTDFALYLASHSITVSVATAAPYYPGWKIREGYDGKIWALDKVGPVEVRRAWHYVRPKPGFIGRIFHELTLCIFSSVNMLRALRGAEIVFIVTPDLSHAFVASIIARLCRVPQVLIVQDVMPDAAVELGMMTNGPLIRFSRALARVTYGMADEIVTLSEGMRRRIRALSSAAKPIHLLPNPVDLEELSGDPHPNSFRQRFGAENAFLVVHSGNMGEKQNLEILLRVAVALRDEPGIRFLVIGDGAVREAFLARVRELKLANVTHDFLLPRELFVSMLHQADVFFISQQPEVVDIVVPSKLMTAMGAGANIVAAVNAESETARILSESGGGVIASAVDAADAAERMLWLRSRPEIRAENRRKATAYAKANLDRDEVYSELMRIAERVAWSAKEKSPEP